MCHSAGNSTPQETGVPALLLDDPCAGDPRMRQVRKCRSFRNEGAIRSTFIYKYVIYKGNAKSLLLNWG